MAYLVVVLPKSRSPAPAEGMFMTSTRSSRQRGAEVQPQPVEDIIIDDAEDIGSIESAPASRPAARLPPPAAADGRPAAAAAPSIATTSTGTAITEALAISVRLLLSSTKKPLPAFHKSWFQVHIQVHISTRGRALLVVLLHQFQEVAQLVTC